MWRPGLPGLFDGYCVYLYTDGRFAGGVRLGQEEQVEFKIAVLGGDGIGPEVTAQGVMVLKALERLYGHRFDLEYRDVGGVSMDNHGTERAMRTKRASFLKVSGLVFTNPRWPNATPMTSNGKNTAVRQ